MPDQFSPDFSHKVLEADIARLVLEIKKHREKPETSSFSEKELLKKSIQSATASQTGAEPQKAEPSQSSPGFLPNYVQNVSSEIRLEVENLVDIAFHKGIEEAANEARKSNNPFILDVLHDTLTAKFYPEFKKRGLLK